MAMFKWVLSGALPPGDVWQVGFHFTTPDVPSQVAGDAVLAAQTFADSLWNGAAGGSPGVKTLYPNGTTFNQITIYTLDRATGHALTKATVGLALAGTAASTALPNQLAVAVSLNSNTPGRRGRGRAFMPAPAATLLTPLGRISPGTVTNIAQSVGISLRLMQTSGFPPCLFTPGQPDRLITAGSVGDVFDTQRRRRNKLVEARSTAVPINDFGGPSVLVPRPVAGL
jgi:hypothetical protein